MNTAPAPNAAAPPGMCPGAVVESGGGAGGGGDGSGGEGGPNEGGASDSGAAADGSGDASGANDPAEQPESCAGGDPVDVATGRAYTLPLLDFELPGPLPLRFERTCSSAAVGIDAGLGPGWAHTLGWCVEERRRGLRVWTDRGIRVDFPALEVGQKAYGKWGWLLAREAWGYLLDRDDGTWRMFSARRPGTDIHLLTAIEDRNRNRIELSYSDHGARLHSVRDSGGRLLRVETDVAGRIVSFTVADAPGAGRTTRLVEYRYDERGRLSRVVDPEGHHHAYAYDADGRFVSSRDRCGLTFHFRYDAQGRCVETYGDYPEREGFDASLVDPPRTLHDGGPLRGIHHCRFEYIDGVTFLHDSTQTRTFFHNRHGLIDKREDGGGVRRNTYRVDGHRMTRQDAMGALTTYERDVRGRITKVTDPLDNTTELDIDRHGLVGALRDPSGAETTYERDGAGNLVTVRDALGGITRIGRERRGLVVSLVRADGGTVRATYDDAGNLVEVVKPSGAAWRYTYDALGRRLGATDPLGATTSYSYTPRGDVAAVRDAAGGVTRYQYDGERRIVEVRSPGGATTRLEWGGLNKLTRRIDANGHGVRLGYNVEGELTHVWNETGELHRIRRDPAGRVVGEESFDGRTTRIRNDAAGRPVRVTDHRGRTTQLEYDLAGRLIRRLGPGGAEETFRYDHAGLVVAATSGQTIIELERDALGRVVRESQQHDGATHHVERRLDPIGRRLGRRTSLGHEEIVTRNLDGRRIASVLDGERISHVTDPLGRETRRSLDGGGAITSEFDTLGRLARRSVSSPRERIGADGRPAWVGAEPPVAVDQRYRYSADGELLELDDAMAGATAYEYAPNGSLIARRAPGSDVEVFRHDAAGNLLGDDAAAAPRAYGPGNRLLRCGQTEYGWDPDGRLVSKRTTGGELGESSWTFTWNDAGLLASSSSPDVHVEYDYDSFARRLQKRVYESKVATPLGVERGRLVETTRFVWDGSVLAHEIRERTALSGDPVVEERTYWFEDDGFEPRAHRDGGVPSGWVHYVNDPVGTPTRLVDAGGTVSADYHRLAWGRMEPRPGARTTTPLRLPGQYADEETGLHYSTWRYLDPGVGRWIRSDPLGLRGGTNAYAYVRDPYSWIDPLGLADPGLPELIAAFEARYPGRPYQTGHTRRHSDGRDLEIDFETDNVIIEVKGGSGAGLGRQVTDRSDPSVNPSGKPVVGYSASRMGPHVRREIDGRGGIAADRSQLDVLLDAIAPDPPP